MDTCAEGSKTTITSTNQCITIPSNTSIVKEETSNLEITVNKREFNVVGDELYIPKLYDDAPQWLKDLVNVVVQVGVESNNKALLIQAQELVNALADITVPLNTYTQSILALNTEDSRLNSVIDTLNSNLTDGLSSVNAQILNVEQTYVSKEEASATVVDIISAQLDNGVLDNVATIGHVSNTLATETQARALDYTTLESEIAGEATAQAQATQTIRTYVGIDNAGAGTGTGLSAYLEASDGTIGGADSQVTNDIRVSAEGVEAKWAYNSVVNINGVYKKSGFGLTTNYTSGSGTEANPYSSEFWIDASRLRFTNSAQTGSVSPFTIDATGAVPKVYFNGIVEFTGLGINTNSTTINGSKIATGSIDASRIATNTLTASQIDVNNLFAQNITATGTISGATLNGGVINGVTIDATSDITAPIIYSDRFRILAENYPNNSGAIYHRGLEFISNGHAVGYTANRICSSNSSLVISVSATGYGGNNGAEAPSTDGSVDFYLEQSINGGSWSTIHHSGGVNVTVNWNYVVPSYNGDRTYSFRFRHVLNNEGGGYVNIFQPIQGILQN